MTEPMKDKSRIKFPKGKQRDFLEHTLLKFNLCRLELSEIFDINIRTLSDLFQEKSTLSYESFSRLRAKYSVSLPNEAKIISRFWYARKAGKLGALMRNKLHGNPGTAEGRRKGGLISMDKFRADPHLAVKLGVKLRKTIKYPRKSLELAEFVGVVLGDGGLTAYQLRVTLNSDTDKEYGVFVRSLIKRLFGLSSRIIFPKNGSYFDIVVYSKSLIEFLVSLGLVRGSKVKNKADIPFWIKQRRTLSLRCLRGLMDTDGSFYQYNHVIRNTKYRNYALCFTNHSVNLINSAYSILKAARFRPSKTLKRVYLYRKEGIVKYFRIVGSSNPKHIAKYKKVRIC